MKNENENIKIGSDDLISSFLGGNASEEEINMLRLWIGQSSENREKFIQAKVAWMASAQMEKGDAGETREALYRLKREIRRSEGKPSGTMVLRIKQISKIAAFLLLAISVGSLGTYLMMRTQMSGHKGNNMIYVYAPKGSKAVTILPDGTKVWLNAGSNLSYNCSQYGKTKREVTLIGEGFFKVVSDASRPFIVKAKNLQIKALGTSFNVKAYPEELKVQTTLVEGLVKIEGEDTDKHSFSVTLKPNQQVSMITGKSTINKVPVTDPNKIETENLENIQLESISENQEAEPLVTNIKSAELYTSWKDDQWIFKGEEIGDLATLLERRFNINVVFDSEELKKYRFTGTFQNETIEQVMQVLKLTTPLKFEFGKGKVVLTLDSALKAKYKKYLTPDEQ